MENWIASPLEIDDFLIDSFRDLREDLDNGNFSEAMLKSMQFGCKGYKRNRNPFCLTELFLHQHPEEVCFLLSTLVKNDIRSYFEIGVESGGFLFLVDSFIRVFNSNYDSCGGIDKTTDHPYLEKYLNEYISKKSNDFKILNGNCFGHTPEKKYDFLFIDNNIRKVENMLNCFNLYLPHVNKIIGFHDINDPKMAAQGTVAELEKIYRVERFCNSSAGIGLVFINEEKS